MKDENKDLRQKLKKLFTRQQAKKIIVIHSTDVERPALIVQSDLLLRRKEYAEIETQIEEKTNCSVAILPPTLRINAIIAGEQKKGGKA